MACSLSAILSVFPEALIKRPYYRTRFQANQKMELVWRPSSGDVFAALPGRVRPPTDDEPYAAFELAWDADGFRVPAVEYENYPIAVFGDSFTEGFSVPFPYPDRLAELLGVGVRNYGYRAYGPDEISSLWFNDFYEEAMANLSVTGSLSLDYKWVIWGFFSGNDLGDTMRPPLHNLSSPWGQWSAFLGQYAASAPTATPRLGEDGQPQYDFPVPVIIGGNYYELAFVPYYWYWQEAPDEGFESSRNFEHVAQAVGTLTSYNEKVCNAFVFIPTKEQLYLPYVHPDVRQFLRAINQRPQLGKSGQLVYVEAPVAEEDEAAFFESLYGQRDAMKRLIEDERAWRGEWVFIDLLPAFEEAVARGELLYYPYDTHWNQAGHDLAAQVIADTIRATPGCDV